MTCLVHVAVSSAGILLLKIDGRHLGPLVDVAGSASAREIVTRSSGRNSSMGADHLDGDTRGRSDGRSTEVVASAAAARVHVGTLDHSGVRFIDSEGGHFCRLKF